MMRIGLVGGTGREGRGLALRWAKAGHEVAIGSRDEARARSRAEELRAVAHGSIEGGSNEWAVSSAAVVVLSVPHAAHDETLRSLASLLEGRVVIDITVPLRPPKVHEVHLPEGHAAALAAQAILGPKAPVAAALHHVSSAHLADPAHVIDSDVLVCADDARAMDVTITIIQDLGMRALDAGPLRNAVALESLTPVLLHLIKRYKTPCVGLRLTGIRGSGQR